MPVDAGQLMNTVNTLIGVVMQQHQQMQADMRAIQANAEAWGQETQRNNGGNGAEHGYGLNLNKFVELVPQFYPKASKHLEAEWWVEEIEKTFAALEVPENKKVDYVAYVLRGDANSWWSSTKSMAGGPMTWDQFKQAFYVKFFLENVRQQMLQDFYTL